MEANVYWTKNQKKTEKEIDQCCHLRDPKQPERERKRYTVRRKKGA